MAAPERLGDMAAVAELRQRIAERAQSAVDDPRLEEDRLAGERLIAELEASLEARWTELIPRKFVNARVTDLEGARRDAADEWVDLGMKSNVLLLGNVGTGKTHTAVAMARAAFDQGRTVRFVSVVDLLAGLRPEGEIRWRPETIDVLVLDDLGVEKPTDWALTTLDGLIDARWKEERPTLVTSNLNEQALERAVGPRMWSRLYNDSVRRKLAGDDRRR